MHLSPQINTYLILYLAFASKIQVSLIFYISNFKLEECTRRKVYLQISGTFAMIIFHMSLFKGHTICFPGENFQSNIFACTYIHDKKKTLIIYLTKGENVHPSIFITMQMFSG